jgi:low affinity Fe/Cu permease
LAPGIISVGWRNWELLATSDVARKRSTKKPAKEIAIEEAHNIQGPMMAQDEPSGLGKTFAKVANATSQIAGRASTFILAVLVIVIWAVLGPIFHYSDTWQLVINTGTTIVTFLMVFLIQNSQNRDSAAIQVKLDELIRSSEAQNSFVGIEHLTAKELEDLRALCEDRAKAHSKAEITEKKVAAKAQHAGERRPSNAAGCPEITFIP